MTIIANSAIGIGLQKTFDDYKAYAAGAGILPADANTSLNPLENTIWADAFDYQLDQVILKNATRVPPTTTTLPPPTTGTGTTPTPAKSPFDKKYDTNDNGEIDAKELVDAARLLGVDPTKLDPATLTPSNLFDAVDDNNTNDDKISVAEFNIFAASATSATKYVDMAIKMGKPSPAKIAAAKQANGTAYGEYNTAWNKLDTACTALATATSNAKAENPLTLSTAQKWYDAALAAKAAAGDAETKAKAWQTAANDWAALNPTDSAAKTAVTDAGTALGKVQGIKTGAETAVTDATTALNGVKGIKTAVQAMTTQLYRFYNPTTGDYIYTTTSNPEYATLSTPNSGWDADGSAGYISPTKVDGVADVAIYRYSNSAGLHLFTAVDPGSGWTKEGSKPGNTDPIGYVSSKAETGTAGVYQLEKTTNGYVQYFFTTDATEAQNAVDNGTGWTNDNITCYVVPGGSPARSMTGRASAKKPKVVDPATAWKAPVDAAPVWEAPTSSASNELTAPAPASAPAPDVAAPAVYSPPPSSYVPPTYVAPNEITAPRQETVVAAAVSVAPSAPAPAPEPPPAPTGLLAAVMQIRADNAIATGVVQSGIYTQAQAEAAINAGVQIDMSRVTVNSNGTYTVN